jgi:arylamine N-acetyltransferase
MAHSPLTPPSDRSVLDAFVQHFGLPPDGPPLVQLRGVVSAFAELPYENLTKIIKSDACGSPSRARRYPAEVVGDHVAAGTGGTCFSLTAALLHLVRALGWRAEPVLADRRYGANTHCALLVWAGDRPHLIDPGFLILDPIPLDAARETHVPTAFNELVLTPQAGGQRVELATVGHGRRTYRLTFRTAPADEGEFLQAWDASFDWDMMHYPVLTRVRGGRQLYLQGRRLQTRSREAVDRQEIAPDALPHQIAAAFGLDSRIVARALAVLHRHGDSHG